MRSFSQHGWQKEHLPDCCRSVTAPRLRLMKRLTYLNCWIWLAGYGVIPSCARSPAFLSGIFQCTFCLPVSYPHTRHERIPGRDHLSRKSSSHKVLTEKHVLRGVLIKIFFYFLYRTVYALPDVLLSDPFFRCNLPVCHALKKIKMQPLSLHRGE